MVGIAAAGGVDPLDPREFEHLPHAVEEVVLEFAERPVWMGQALLGEQVCGGLRARPESERLSHVVGEILESSLLATGALSHFSSIIVPTPRDRSV